MSPTLYAEIGRVLRETHWSGRAVEDRTQVDVVLAPHTALRPAALLHYRDEHRCTAIWRIGGQEIARTSGTREQCTAWLSRGCPVEVTP